MNIEERTVWRKNPDGSYRWPQLSAPCPGLMKGRGCTATNPDPDYPRLVCRCTKGRSRIAAPTLEKGLALPHVVSVTFNNGPMSVTRHPPEFCELSMMGVATRGVTHYARRGADPLSAFLAALAEVE